MQKFRYRAKREDGRDLTGWVEAAGFKSAAAVLRSRNLVVISLIESKENILNSLLFHFQHVSQSDIVDFTRQLATMLNAGLPLVEALKSLEEQSKPALKRIINEILNDVRGGLPLFNALSKHPKYFSRTYLALVKSGETAGTLDKVLKKLAENMEKQRRFKGAVKSALIYPTIVIITMIVVGFLVMVFVIPKLLVMFKDMNVTLPLPTLILITISDFTSRFWWLVICLAAGGVYAFLTYKKTRVGRQKVDYLTLNIPLFGNLLKKVILADLMRTLSMLISTGVSIIDALNIVAEASPNVVFEEAILDAAKDVSRGVPLASNFSKYEFFPPILSQMVAIGEETGKLDEVLERVANYFEEESDQAIKGLTSAIEPLMIVFLALGVAFLVFAIIMPIYNLTSSF